jgi:alkanesulfonate monooxygenase SsuD/methylene tetrahydromethanopterin reductase-like flavin-dependent oxidoreductase (luciferase family)
VVDGGERLGEHAAHGLAFPGPGSRARRLDEAVQILRLLWSGEPVRFAGRHYALHEAVCRPRPLQRPAPPLWIGGAGERVLLRTVARNADGWNVSLLPPDAYAAKARVLARHCADLGRDPTSIRRSLVATVIGAEREADARRLLAELERHWTGSLQRAPNVVGDADACADRLAPYLALGVRDFVVRAHVRPHGAELVAGFVEHVAPRLRAGAAMSDVPRCSA